MRRGTYIQERYRVDAHLGTGDLGSIWNGTDTLLNRPVTIKVLHPELARDDEIRDRFRHTAMRVAALDSSEIIDIYDHIEQFTFDNEVVACQITGQLSGTPLARLLRREGPLDAERTLTILGRVARGLHLAHRASVIHRNLKPGNVLLGADNTVTLIGFGFLDSHATPPAHSPDQPSSSVPYAAPELFDKQPATVASDIYSLGVIGYECLTGHNPFDRETATEIAVAHARVTPAELPAELPWQARQAVTLALAKRPTNRHESARAMAEMCGVTHGFSDNDDETVTLALPTTQESQGTVPVARGRSRIQVRDNPDETPDPADEDEETTQGDLAPGTARRLPAGNRHKSYKYSAIVAVVVLALTGSGLLAHFGLPVAAEESPPGAMAPTSTSSDSSSQTPSDSATSSQDSSSSEESSSTSSAPTTSTPPPSSSSSSSSSSSDPTSEPEEAPVPGVIGMTAPEATDELQAAEFGANVEHEGEGDIECAVHAQDPAAGTELPPGSTVTVNVRLAATEEECQQPV